MTEATDEQDALARARALKRQRDEALRDLEVIKRFDGQPYPDLAGLETHGAIADAELD